MSAALIRLTKVITDFEKEFGFAPSNDKISYILRVFYGEEKEFELTDCGNDDDKDKRKIESKDKETFMLALLLYEIIPNIKPKQGKKMAEDIFAGNNNSWKEELEKNYKVVVELKNRAIRSTIYWKNLESFLSSITRKKKFSSTKNFVSSFLGKNKTSIPRKVTKLGAVDPYIEVLKLMSERRDREALSLIEKESGENSELHKLILRLLQDRVAEDDKFKQETLNWRNRK